MRVRFWGVRGSCPAPTSSGELKKRLAQVLRLYATQQSCAQAAGEAGLDLEDDVALASWLDSLSPTVSSFVGSNTPCVEFLPFADGGEDSGPLFIIDMGSGLRALGNALMEREFGRGEGQARIFLSHFHWDHIQGFPFFKPAYVSGNRLDIHTRHDHLHSRLLRQQEAPFFPPEAWEAMRAEIEFHQMGSGPQVLDGVRVSSLELSHPSKSYAYRFECAGRVLVYASDGAYENLDDASIQPFVEFYQNADVLIFDAQFSLSESFVKRSWGHSSAIVGLELASQARVKKLVLFHHDPDADDTGLQHLLEAAQSYASHAPAALRRRGHSVEMIIAREGDTLDF